jgi:hypothetical protein
MLVICGSAFTGTYSFRGSPLANGRETLIWLT